ncbi:hypothetical protein SJAG_02361 [Schizosaccharomyces japonicus yFS275]|uniref:Uncharacterized protein n=1 Tax=Schizosaccharomyces japonicus (strain yFS275 / FY16936) TaxID=402676 RepID=B6K294_SCHJY|nr:hypothetical protein SJAG_02361 [Schizosaccharomyces japonicus yFS275]EEB07275.1 hypothetical protein SJAG_02361 [Schizosaccharomyces japonicus yFS275]
MTTAEPVEKVEVDVYSDIDEDFRESIEQIEKLFCLVLFPIVGRFLGRKFAFYAWGRCMDKYAAVHR